MRYLLAIFLILVSGAVLAQVVYEPDPRCEISTETCDGDDCVRICFPDG